MSLELSLQQEIAPALLNSFVYLDEFQKIRKTLTFRDWAMDSGAFSAHRIGSKIALPDYIETCKNLMARDLELSDIFALDVIGDWHASLQNVHSMWAHGVEAIPCFHHGEPWDLLVGLAHDYPKVAIGGCVGLPHSIKYAFAQQCFARTWPKKLHGFGFGSTTAVMVGPWHSVDASTWITAARLNRRWQVYGYITSPQSTLHSQVQWYLELEHRARHRWRQPMRELQCELSAPTIRLVAPQNAVEARALVKTLRKD